MIVPLRELFEQHREDVLARLDRIDDKLTRIDDRLTDHDHGKHVTWMQLVPLLVTLIITAGLLS